MIEHTPGAEPSVEFTNNATTKLISESIISINSKKHMQRWPGLC